MKIAYCSDLHLEIEDLVINNTDDVDVLVLAGDILEAHTLYEHPEQDISHTPTGSRRWRAQVFRDFIKRASQRFPAVIVVAGNHEFYRGRWHGSLKVLREIYSQHDNVHFLEGDSVVINDTRFIGATLWTDVNKHNPMSMQVIQNSMNDYRLILNDGRGDFRYLRVSDTIARFNQTLSYFKKCTEEFKQEKTVVVSHMAPSSLSIPEKYKDSTDLNGAYFSDLSEFILDRPQIKLWIHGHVHTECDYLVGDCRVVCNPRGYVGYERGSQEIDPFYPKIVEV